MKHPTANPVSYFEIPVVDMERAIQFYERVFLTSLERENIDGNSMALFPHSEGGHGIAGALAKGDSYVPSTHGARIYFNVKDIDATLNRVSLAGGDVVYPKTSIGDLGWVAEFKDSEGNVLALHSTNE